MTRCIFLDIDGVLNSVQQSLVDKHAYCASNINEVSLGLIKWVCDVTHANLVISSTWKRNGIDWICGVFEARGWLSPPFATPGVTPRCEGIRGNEIAAYIQQNQVDQYVIIDDDSDMLEEQKPFFVYVDPLVGFNIYNALQAVNILCGDIDDRLVSDLNNMAKFRTRKEVKHVTVCGNEKG